MLSLSFSLQSNKGTYALLIGSGVSRGAQIPTGWEVLEDLIQQIALLEKEDTGGDPAAWYAKKFGAAPDYSKVLDAVVKSPTERSRLLRKYFEPTDEERERGEKAPTAAHEAIAKLVAAGYIKVIVTTNFDRLIETALEKQGISPVVIATPDSIKGAPPLVHSVCTIIKLHGDYIDTRIRNTADELSSYDAATNKLLDQVFDEYGLIVCGWSAEWDTALRAAFERCKSNRFTTYWTSRRDLVGAARDLAALRKAQVIKIGNADAFFSDLEQKLSALEEYDRPHPLSVKTAVASLKRNLSEDRYHIQLHDQLSQETERVFEELTGPHFTAQVAGPNSDFCYDRLKRYEASVEILQALMANCAYFASHHQAQLLTKTLNRIATRKEVAGTVLLLYLQRYPVLLLEYAAGMAAIAAGNYGNLKAVFDAKEKEPGKDPTPLTDHATCAIVDSREGNAITKQESMYAPISEHLFNVLREPLTALLPGDENYAEAFDRLEIHIALSIADRALKAGDTSVWVPVGRFGWEGRFFGGGPLISLGKEMDRDGANWPPLKAGLFGSQAEAKAAFEAVKAFVDRLQWR